MDRKQNNTSSSKNIATVPARQNSTKSINNSNANQNEAGTDSDLNPTKRSRYDLRSRSKLGSNQPPQEQFVSLNSLPPEQAALSIEKVRKTILSSLHPKDLLKLRLVSRLWCQDATNEKLLNWDKNKIRIKRATAGNYYIKKWKGNRVLKRPLKQLITQMSKTGSRTFPCSNFEINYNNLISEDKLLRSFLTKHGHRMKKLDLIMLCFIGCEEFPTDSCYCIHTINWFTEFITWLLLNQVPNLEKFRMVEAGIRASCFSWDDNELVCNPIVNTIDKIAPEIIHSKLQSVKLSVKMGQKPFDLICRIAPNLKEFETFDLAFFLEPVNRLHLLKELTYLPCSEDARYNSVIKRIANTEGELQLKEFSLDTESVYEHPENYKEVTDIVNKLFEKSCHSFETLRLTPMGFLHDHGIKLPQMPNVKHLYCVRDPHYEDRTFLPRGFRMSEIFPNLRTMRLNSGITMDIITREDYFLLGCESDVMNSVKKILIEVNSANSEKYQRWFPNARIKAEHEFFPPSGIRIIRL